MKDLLHCMDRAFRPELAGVERELLYKKLIGYKMFVLFQVLTDADIGRRFWSRQSDVRLKLPPLGDQTGPAAGLLHLALQLLQFSGGMDSRPAHFGRAFAHETTNASQLQTKRRGLHVIQFGDQFFFQGRVGVADESQGDMQLFRRRPTYTGDSMADRSRLFADRRIEINGNEQALHSDFLAGQAPRSTSVCFLKHTFQQGQIAGGGQFEIVFAGCRQAAVPARGVGPGKQIGIVCQWRLRDHPSERFGEGSLGRFHGKEARAIERAEHRTFQPITLYNCLGDRPDQRGKPIRRTAQRLA